MTELKSLRQKYQTRAPRYTSYPTAPMFHPLSDVNALFHAWRHASAARALYVHVPYCRHRCWYCGCQVEIRKPGEIGDAYVDWLLTELDLRMAAHETPRRFVQLALGGGTPTFLSPNQMTRFMEALRQKLPIAKDAEVSIELDPRTVNAAYADRLVTLGFNRFSLGVQDFDQRVLRSVNREQSESEVEALQTRLRAHGSVNFDLIYGLPGQTLQTFTHTANTVARMHPDRIALFGYAHVPWMKPHQKALERTAFPEDRSQLADAATQVFLAAGYEAIGFDHFALPNDDLAVAARTGHLHRNFMGYTSRGDTDLIGIGASAISDIAGVYTQNEKNSDQYVKVLKRGLVPVARGYVLSADDLLRRRLILSLFCNFKVGNRELDIPNTELFAKRFAKEYVRLAALADDGLVVLTDDAIQVTELGRAFIRNVCAVFDRYLEADPAERRYSLTG